MKIHQEINTETYLKKIKIKRQNMEEIDNITCMKKIDLKLKEYQRPWDKKIKIKKIDFFTFHCIKHRTRSSVFQRK